MQELTEQRFVFWWRWLLAATGAVLAFGLSMVLLPGPTQQLFSFIYLSSPHGSAVFGEAAVVYIKFISAVLGATMFGWSVALLYVLFGSFRRRNIEGWRTVTVSVGAWFIPDTTYSLWSGYWQNAVLNIILLALFAVPLAATAKAFQRPPNQAL
jgi:hypothetical protein